MQRLPSLQTPVRTQYTVDDDTGVTQTVVDNDTDSIQDTVGNETGAM